MTPKSIRSEAQTDPTTDPTSEPLSSARSPHVTLPKPFETFTPSPARDRLGWRPLRAVVGTAREAALEVAAADDWTDTFGVAAPPVATVEERLQVAADWSALLEESRQWLLFVQSLEGDAWKNALEVLRTLKAPFQLAATVDPSVRARFPALARLLDAQGVVARRSAATKKKQAAEPGRSSDDNGEP